MSDILPQFSKINPNLFVTELENLLQTNLDAVEAILHTHKSFSWDNLMQPLEDMDDKLERFWSPLSHLHAVVNSPKLRDCYQACLPKLSAYEAALAHNETLFNAIKSVDQKELNSTQIKILEDILRDFELSGVALPKEKKQRFEAIQARLSALANQFENNILDATQAFNLHLTEEKALTGLPEHALHAAKELAAEKGLSGWMLNLEFPCYVAVITYAEDRALREKMYHAFVTRASDVEPSAAKFDNSAIMEEILNLRHEKSQLLGFANYAELSLATKMAESASLVLDFLFDLTKRSHSQADREFKQLQHFAKTQYNLTELAPWDIAYLSEKKRQALHAISQEELRPYFSQDKVMQGLFTIIQQLFGMQLELVNNVDVWHPDVKCYRVIDEAKNVRGYIYADLYARSHKRGGAWMDSFQSRRGLSSGEVQLPIASLTCNFAKPVANKMAILSHDEVLTLFHEFGHCLHHVLTQVDYLNASGINGVEWDAVELPSQFLENWCWEKEAVLLLTAHVDTGEALPDAMYQKMIAAKNFQSAMAMVRQLEFSLFDFCLHQEFNPNKSGFIDTILAEIRKKTAVVPIAPYNRFQHSFSHIFAGGYAAGYYSYKWAEVLSSDAFARFEEEGIFNPTVGRAFLHSILETGGSRKAKDSFLEFRGRPATVDALLRHNGINNSQK